MEDFRNGHLGALIDEVPNDTLPGISDVAVALVAFCVGLNLLAGDPQWLPFAIGKHRFGP